jgi:hypothetical protein
MALTTITVMVTVMLLGVVMVPVVVMTRVIVMMAVMVLVLFQVKVPLTALPTSPCRTVRRTHLPCPSPPPATRAGCKEPAVSLWGLATPVAVETASTA